MKIYNVTGYLIIFSYMLACMYFAPAHLGPWTGMLIGGVYFIFCWFLGGLYLADLLHLGIAHRSLDYKEWTSFENCYASSRSISLSTVIAPVECVDHWYLNAIRDRGSTFSSHLSGGANQFPGGTCTR